MIFGRNVKEMALEFYSALGKKANISDLDNCFTRVRVSVKNLDAINLEAIKEAGAKEIVITGEDYVQIVVGSKADEIKTEMEELMNNDK